MKNKSPNQNTVYTYSNFKGYNMEKNIMKNTYEYALSLWETDFGLGYRVMTNVSEETGAKLDFCKAVTSFNKGDLTIGKIVVKHYKLKLAEYNKFDS